MFKTETKTLEEFIYRQPQPSLKSITNKVPLESTEQSPRVESSRTVAPL